MIDININALISQALSAAVQQAVDAHILAIRQEYANKMGEMAERIAALENNPAQGDTLSPDDLVQIKQRIAALEQAMEEHTENYDHDDMLMSDALPDMDDYIKREELDVEVRDAVRDIMSDAKVSVRF